MKENFWNQCKTFWQKVWKGVRAGISKVWQKIREPRAGVLAAVYVATALVCALAITAAILTTGENAEGRTWLAVLGYISYGVAALLLTYTVYTLVKILPRRYRALKEKLRSHKRIGRLMQNYGLRTVIFATVSVAVTLAFATYHAVIAYLYHSVWFGALATYYIILLIIRGGIVLYHGKRRGKERKKEIEIRKYRSCGIGLMITISALSATIFEMVQNSAATKRAGLMIYVVATYTFYKITMAIINFVRAKKQDDHTVDALRNINVADAAVSLLALQASMIQEFSETGFPLANALTGAGVCLFVFGLGLYMAIRAAHFKKRLQNEVFTGEEDERE
ncbi:MAG: hypothetical protein IJY63_02200 [Clostridia bacterium]|nr:hypothetical protein [Clostridia bacterium]